MIYIYIYTQYMYIQTYIYIYHTYSTYLFNATKLPVPSKINDPLAILFGKLPQDISSPRNGSNFFKSLVVLVSTCPPKKGLFP